MLGKCNEPQPKRFPGHTSNLHYRPEHFGTFKISRYPVIEDVNTGRHQLACLPGIKKITALLYKISPLINYRCFPVGRFKINSGAVVPRGILNCTPGLKVLIISVLDATSTLSLDKYIRAQAAVQAGFVKKIVTHLVLIWKFQTTPLWSNLFASSLRRNTIYNCWSVFKNR